MRLTAGVDVNWQQRIFRLWLLAATAWIAYQLWDADIPCLFGYDLLGTKWWCADPLARPRDVFFQAAYFVLVPPIIVGVLLAGLVWAVLGFKRQDQNS